MVQYKNKEQDQKDYISPEEFSKKWKKFISSDDAEKKIYENFRMQAMDALTKTFGWKPRELPEGKLDIRGPIRTRIMEAFWNQGNYFAPTRTITIGNYDYPYFMMCLAHEFVHEISHLNDRTWHPWERKHVDFANEIKYNKALPNWLIEGTVSLATRELVKTMTEQTHFVFNEFQRYPAEIRVAEFLMDTVGEGVFWQCFFNNRNFSILAKEFCKKKVCTEEKLRNVLDDDDPVKVLVRLKMLKDRVK